LEKYAALVALDLLPETEHTLVMATAKVEAVYGHEDVNNESNVEIEDLVSNTDEKMATKISHVNASDELESDDVKEL